MINKYYPDLVKHLKVDFNTISDSQDQSYFMQYIIQYFLKNTNKITETIDFFDKYYEAYVGNKSDFIDYTEIKLLSCEYMLGHAVNSSTFGAEIVLKEKIYQWIKRKREIVDQANESNQSKDNFTTKQQILIIYYLHHYKLIDINKIHSDQTSQARILSAVFNRNYDNTYKYWNDILRTKAKENYFTIENLEKIQEVFKVINNQAILDDIKDRLSKLKS
jgi:hypothetical protein